MDIFQMLNNHQLAAHHHQQLQQPLNPRNETEELLKNLVEKNLVVVDDKNEDPLPSYHTFSNMANKQSKNENINDNDNIENTNNGNNENDDDDDDPYRMPIANEDLLQRQFNLYRYYLSQYPELFQEYFQIQHEQQQQLQQNLMEQQQQRQKPGDLYLINNNIKNNNNNDDDDNDNHLPYQSSQQKDVRQQQYRLQTIRKLPNKRINNSNNNIERCRFLCRCSKCCQKSDSSIWSEQSSSGQQIIESSINNDNDGLMMMMMMNNQQNSAKFQQQQHRRPVPQATSNALYYLNANNLLEDERYEHLSRVITPPNAFLNIHHHQQNQNQSQQSSKNLNDNDKGAVNDNSIMLDDKSKPSILYSDKRTQTDTMELKQNGQTAPTYQKVDKLAKNLQRQLSLAEEKREKMKKMKAYSENNHLKHSLEFSSEPIYHTINDGGSFDQLSDPIYSVKLHDTKYNNDGFNKSNNRNWWKKSEKQSKISYEQNDLKNQIQALYDKQRIKFEKQNPDLNAEQQPHRIPTSKNGIPCSCERCRESRGMNLTTELLPIDTQIPLQTMDNMDSFFQDSSMAELICRIM